MDKQEYLNQISPESAKPGPAQPSLLDKVLKSKFTWIGLGVTILLVVILGIGAALQANKPNPVQKIAELLLLINSTTEVVDGYQADLRSSQLRGYSASLGSVLADTSGKLNTYLAGTPKNSRVVPAASAAVIKQQKEEAVTELDNAIINGYLDKTYAIKIAYLISAITARENEILKTTQNETLQETLTTSQESLENLYESFHGFKSY